MHARSLRLGLAVGLFAATVATAQTPTPTPIDSNVGVSAFAQTRGQDPSNTPCTSRGGLGCGGCYPHRLPVGDPTLDLLAQLSDVNPEWAPLAPMIPGFDDGSLPPPANPVVVTGSIGLSKSPGDDFPGTHVTADYNAEIIPDNNSRLATGNTNERVEFEWEGNKLPMFAWSGEGDRMVAVGRWIFDCGHPDPVALGTCSNNPTQTCYASADCASCTSGTCTNNSQACTAVQQCATCNNAQFAYQSEMHPPQAVAVIRQKALKVGHAVPATQADVYVSNDAGGAGNRCTVTHLSDPNQLLFPGTSCFLHHCSKTTGRNCQIDKDCAGGETCIDLDPADRLANVNAPNFNHCSTSPKACAVDGDCPSGETCVQMANFEFDMPLPSPPAGTATLKKKIVKHAQKGGRMPNPIFTTPTPGILHVLIPMTVPLAGGKMPNMFAGTISAGWKEDTTVLKHAKVKLLSLTITNPLKDSSPALPHVCTNPAGNLTTTACTSNSDCTAVAVGSCNNSGKPCQVDADCAKTDFCTGGSSCVGGLVPGWDLWAEVNGDWIKFAKLDTLGAEDPFAGPPFLKPSPTPLVIKKAYSFDEYIPASGAIHIKASGHSLNCLKNLFGQNLAEGLHTYDLVPGATCLGASSKDVGMLDTTFVGPNFVAAPPVNNLCTAASTPFTCCTGLHTGTCTPNSSCTSSGTPLSCCSGSNSGTCTADDLCTAAGVPFGCCTGFGTGSCETTTCVPSKTATGPTVCTAMSVGGEGGTCSVTTNQLCVGDTDCTVGTCSVTGGACHTASQCKHCSGTATKFCGSDTDCAPSSGTCVSGSETCTNGETCNGACSADSTNAGTSCHTDGDCTGGGTCDFGGAFTLQYSIQVK